MVQSQFTGKRSMAIAPSGAFGKGAKEGVKNATSKRYWRTGYDAMDAADQVGKYDNPKELNYGNSTAGKGVGKWVNGVYRVMGAGDHPYRYGAKAEVLANLAKVEAINKGLKGTQRKQYIAEFLENPPAESVNRAIEEGRFAVFQDDTALGKAAKFVSNGFREKGWNGAAAIVDFIVPFAKIPGSVATRLIRRTPIGTAQEIGKQIIRVQKGEAYDQRAMSQAIGEGLAGAPIIAAGYALANAGQLTGGYPTDEKERKLWQAEGKQPNSVRIGDRWYSLNYIQPFGALLNIGAGAHQADKDGKDGMDVVWAGLGEGGKSLAGMSFLQGVSGAIDAVQTPERAAERPAGAGGMADDMEHAPSDGRQQWRPEPSGRCVTGGCSDGGFWRYRGNYPLLKPCMLAIGAPHLAAINTNGIVRNSITCAAGRANKQHVKT
jgi:hypothetical protein